MEAPVAQTKRPLIEAIGLSKHFPRRTGTILHRRTALLRAVDDVSFRIFPGETLGLVGESGCGKSTLGRLLIRLIEPTEGAILLDGEDIARLPAATLRELGFTRAVALDGGMKAWREAGFPLICGKEPIA